MASYFQSYFQASSMPKRLLQYALSRLEILDTDALDLENLDIAWGKNSTFEFRDVGLRLKILETLLQLPPSLDIAKARVLLLRLTIPVDIYSSPIVVEVRGVECHLVLKSSPDKSSASTKLRTDHDRTRNRRSPKIPGFPDARSGKNRVQTRPNLDGDEDSDTAIPTAADLAQSFLQTEPLEERAELEAAILSETQDFGASSIYSDDGEVPTGTGAALSLPSFMAKFLQGIVDRLQVKISEIKISLDIDIPNDSSRALPATDPVTVQLKVDDINIEGITHQLNDNPHGTGDSSKLPYKEGKRLVYLSRIRGLLISEASLFSSLARSSAMSSPSVAQSDVFEGRKGSTPSSSSIREDVARSLDGSVMLDGESEASSNGNSMASLPRKSSGMGSLHPSVIASESGRFDDAPEDEATSNMSDSIHGPSSEIGDSVFRSSAYLDQIIDSQYGEIERSGSPVLSSSPRLSATSSHSKSPPSTPRASTHLQLPSPREPHSPLILSTSDDEPLAMLESSILPARPRFSEERISQSQPALTFEAPCVSTEVPQPVCDSDENSTPIGEDDLAQSQLFSHEDVESMYLSAVSYKSMSSIPGGWANSSSGSEGPASALNRSSLAQVEHEPLDNLEHAQQVLIPKSIASNKPSSHYFDHTLQTPTTPQKISCSLPRPNITAVPKSSSNLSERSTTSSDDYARLSKQIFSLDHAYIYLPGISLESRKDDSEADLANSVLDSTSADTGDTSQSTSKNVPGAFSTQLPERNEPYEPHTPSGKAFRACSGKRETKDSSGNTSIEVALGDLLAQFDVSAGRILFKLIHRLKEVLKSESTDVKPASTVHNIDKVFALSMEKLSVRFLERLGGTLGSAGPAFESGQWDDSASADMLLQTTIAGLHLVSHTLKAKTETSITLKKFGFGYAQENIVSFDAGLQMRASVKDLRASDGIDVSLIVTQTFDTVRCNVNTLPVHVSIDLQRLDETFSWFGGLSGVMNLGSSIASNATVTANAGRQKSRGVRFEAPIRPDDSSIAAQNKADVRVGGFILDLVGTDCSVGVETSAIKMVSRDEGIGVSVNKIRLSGPHLKVSDEEPAISVEISGTRIEYLPTPMETDLVRLLSLITPSKEKYDEDDDILLDTLLRQRKQGSVVRLSIEDLQTRVDRLHELSYLPDLGEEVARLATVAKYLPDDERPGLLSLVSVRNFGAYVDVNNSVGIVQLLSTGIEIAQITLPALVAFSANTFSARRNGSEDLFGPATDHELTEPRERASPAIRARMIGDEMEPVVKIKLYNLKVEYRVSTLIVLLGLAESTTPEDISASLTGSVATLTGFARPIAADSASHDKIRVSATKPMTIDIVLRDCVFGLNPLGLSSKLLVILTEARLAALLPKDGDANASIELSKASLLVIDDVANVLSKSSAIRPQRHSFDGGSTQVESICSTGYVSVCQISAAKVDIHMFTSKQGDHSIDVDLRNPLIVLESCADSTQTLIAALNGLMPPTPPSTETKYRTKVIPVHDLLASLSGDAFGRAEGNYNFDDDFGLGEGSEDEFPAADDEDYLEFDSHYYRKGLDAQYDEEVLDDDGQSVASTRLTSRDTLDGVLLDSFVEPQEPQELQALDFQEDHFGQGSVLERTAHRWNSAKNTYDRTKIPKVNKSPLKVCIRDVHIIWNLFDGYDWQNTRDTITKAVQDVESKAIERRARNDRRLNFDQDIDDEETVIGDFLFNSIYIGVSPNRDPRELAVAINQELNDTATETESVATTYVSSTSSRPGVGHKPRGKKLRLSRSKHHKMTFELRGVSADLVVFPPGSGETQNSIDIRVHDLFVFDHVPSSTWKMFATYMQEAGERETGTSMVHIEILNVKPVATLAASEIVLKATVLPLRLHVDQDALDFITRFFEFKDDSNPTTSSPGEKPFIQRAEINSVEVKLDFKPKRVDYAGLRSGHTTEFMNFLILDQADMTLRHTIIYGVSGFDKLGICLNDIWMPDIKRNQLPGILAGIAPVRSLVNVGGGFKHLVVVPMKEYKKDGRIVRGISKGAAAFAKTTGTELVKLGAKVAIGVQTVLQGAEGFLGPVTDSAQTGFEDDPEENKQISLYANQPVGVMQGLRGGYAGLQRDLVLARDAIIAVPGEVMEGGNAAGVIRAVRKHAPTVILRPAIGVAKAGGQILMGATNSLDPTNIQRTEAKYKKH